MSIPSETPYRLKPSPIRRAVGIAVLTCLALYLLFLAASDTALPPAFRLVLGLAGLASAVGAEAMRRATALAVELSDAGITDSAGRLLAPMDQIVSVDRGAFAFKPSNGFVVRLARPAPRGWAPGLWWRFGRSLGIGGVTGRDEARFMAELLAQRLAERGR